MSTELIPVPGLGSSLQTVDSYALTGGLLFTVPLADLPEFGELADRRRNEVRVVLPLLQRVHVMLATNSLERACAVVAAASKHLMCGLSKQSLRRKYEALLASVDEEHPAGNWRALVKGYKGPNQQTREFKAEVKRVSQLNPLSVAEVMQQLRERWAAGEAIPGMGRRLEDGTHAAANWMEYYQQLYPQRPLPKVWPRGFYPLGWSQRNLSRYASSKGARKLHLRGLAAAKAHFPSVPRDPSKLRPMELIVIDDFELDCLSCFPGDAHHKPSINRVAGLMAMCAGTRYKLNKGLGERLERTEEQKDGTFKTVRTGIARIDVQLLIYGIFEKFGLPDYPVTILVENAAAAISPELQLSIETLFGGRVRIERTGLIEHRNLTNGFVERGGKPWEKGWIEAAFAKLWNIMGGIRGYKGNNMRLNAPGDLDAKIAYTKILLGQGERKLNLPADKLAQLRLPFPNLQECERAFDWACQLADTRTNHKYRGFDRVTEFLLEDDGEPQPFAQLALLPPDVQCQVEVVERMESSVERWQRLSQGVTFTPIDRSVLAVFLLTPKRVPYRNHALTFQHGKTWYSYVDVAGDVLAGVQEGTEFLCYLNPAAPEQLHITQLNGARTGTLTRLGGARGMVDVRDKAALSEAAAIQATLINRTLAENRELHAADNALLGAEKEHNAAIVAQHKIETAGMSVAQKIAHAAGENEAQQHLRKRLAQSVQRTAAKISAADAADFLNDEKTEAAAAPTIEPADEREERLSDYS